MDTKTRLLVLLVVLALPLALTATASGAPDCSNPKFSDSPACASDPEPDPQQDGLSCNDAFLAYPEGTSTPDSWEAVPGDSKTVRLTPGDAGRCIDLWTEEAMTFKVDVAGVEGRASRVYVNVRDSHPGDVCWVAPFHDLGDLPFATDEIPPATLNACGTEYAENELVAGEEVRKEGTDGVTPDPLVLTVLSEWKGKKAGGWMDITITANPVAP